MDLMNLFVALYHSQNHLWFGSETMTHVSNASAFGTREQSRRATFGARCSHAQTISIIFFYISVLKLNFMVSSTRPLSS